MHCESGKYSRNEMHIQWCTNRKRRDLRTYTSTKVSRCIAACSKRKIKLLSMATNHDIDFREELEKLRKEDETNCFCFDCGKESNRSDFTSRSHHLFNLLHSCAHCHAGPEFASVNLGVFVCYECATVHKRLGNAISQVKSLRIDTWTEEMFRVSV